MVDDYMASLMESNDANILLYLSDALYQNRQIGPALWLKFAVELGRKDCPIADQPGTAERYAKTLSQLASRRGGTRLKHIGRLASWENVKTALGSRLVDILDESGWHRFHARRLELCGIEQRLIVPVSGITQIIGEANRGANRILSDPLYLEAASKFFESIRLPKEVPRTPI